MVLLGGGIDSAAAAMMLHFDGFGVQGIHFSYGQPANGGEIAAVNSFADYLGITYRNKTLRFPHVIRGDELLARNALFVLAASPLAYRDERILVLGIHAGTNFYDSSPYFVRDMQSVLDGYYGGAVQLMAPFVMWSKAQVVDWSRKHELPFSRTFSCQVGPALACGKCPSCIARKELHVDD